MQFTKKPFLKTFLLCLASATLLSLSFPKTNIWIFVWIGLIPLFFALDHLTRARAFRVGYLCGVMFFVAGVSWLRHVTYLGAGAMILYLSLYFGLFGFCYSVFSKREGFQKYLVLASVWIVLEYARAHLLTGFGWLALGESQYQNLFLIQIADITGVGGVSFLIVIVNLWFKDVFEQAVLKRGFNLQKIIFPSGIIILGLLLVSFTYSVVRLGQFRNNPKVERITVAVVQGNIPQAMKWDSSAWPMILERQMKLTKMAINQYPDLIVWPETSFPGFFWESTEWFEKFREFVQEWQTPILIGAITKEGNAYYNSAILVADAKDKRRELKQYNKLHLVPFGEFIPLRDWFPFLTQIAPIDDFSRGKDVTVFPIDYHHQGMGELDKLGYFDKGHRFSTLICFEDTFAYLARKFAREGAHIFVNITNDAWFKDTRAPFLHLQSSVFRAIENRKSMVRAANTGVSCLIDPVGQVTGFVENSEGKKTFIQGYKLGNVELGFETSFYTKFGDVFTFLAFGCILMMIIRRK